MSKFNFQRAISAIESVKKAAAKDMIKVVVNYSLDAFKKQGYNGQPWREVQRRMSGYAAYEYPKTKGLSRRTKPILVMTGRLRRAVANMANTSRITYTKYDFKVQVKLNTNTVPYADYINKGTANMVARPFMGTTPELRRKLKDTFMKHFRKTLS